MGGHSGPGTPPRPLEANEPGAALRWRVLVDEPLPGAANMARDHALAASAEPGRGTVRFYRWDRATLSFGRNEPVTVRYRELLRRRPEMGAVRRPTGGRAVIHDEELTYSIVLPVRALGGLRGAYDRINEGLVEGLRRLGVDARSDLGPVLPLRAGPCFMGPAGGEVVVAGRKLVGSAQVRIGDAVLQHGSLLLAQDQSPLLVGSEGAGGPLRPSSVVRRGQPQDGAGIGLGRAKSGNNGLPGPSASAPGPVTLRELLGEVPPWDQLVRAMKLGFARVLGGTWEEGSMTDSEVTLAKRLENRYGSSAWTWRR